jgi:hypothetical protein
MSVVEAKRKVTEEDYTSLAEDFRRHEKIKEHPYMLDASKIKKLTDIDNRIVFYTGSAGDITLLAEVGVPEANIKKVKRQLKEKYGDIELKTWKVIFIRDWFPKDPWKTPDKQTLTELGNHVTNQSAVNA